MTYDLDAKLMDAALAALGILTIPLLVSGLEMVDVWRKSVLARQALARDLSHDHRQQHDRIMAEVRDNEAQRQASFDATMTDLLKTQADLTTLRAQTQARLDEVEALRAQTNAQLEEVSALRWRVRTQLDHALAMQAEYVRMIEEMGGQDAADYQAAKAIFDANHARIREEIDAQGQKIGPKPV